MRRGRNFTAWAVAHERLQQVLGTEIGCHWYGWETESFDTCYPVCTQDTAFGPSASPPALVSLWCSADTAKPGFKEGVAMMEARHVHTVPCAPTLGLSCDCCRPV